MTDICLPDLDGLWHIKIIGFYERLQIIIGKSARVSLLVA